MPAIFDTILTQTKAAIDGLALAFGSRSVPTAIRKLPRAEETLDDLPLVCVSPAARGETTDVLTSEDQILAKYPIEVVVVLAGNADYTATNLATVTTWRQQIRRLFHGGTLANAATVFKTDVRPMALYDRAKLNQNYEYSGIEVTFWSVEARTN